MNTLGAWQQSLAWKIQLVYGYSVPVFVFKFGRDRISPVTRYLQRRRRQELARAIQTAQFDLAQSGRNNRCDIIAHSFGTLLITQLLQDPTYDDLAFGRIVLTGSIASRSVPWDHLIAQARLESVLNHCGGQDRWVQIAPYFFPGVDSTGRDGFDEFAKGQEVLSPGFGHSDFFAAEHFASTIAEVWTPFLNNREIRTHQRSHRTGTGRYTWLMARRFWLGRTVLLFALIGAGLVLLHLLAITGDLAQLTLIKTGL